MTQVKEKKKLLYLIIFLIPYYFNPINPFHTGKKVFFSENKKRKLLALKARKMTTVDLVSSLSIHGENENERLPLL